MLLLIGKYQSIIMNVDYNQQNNIKISTHSHIKWLRWKKKWFLEMFQLFNIIKKTLLRHAMTCVLHSPVHQLNCLTKITYFFSIGRPHAETLGWDGVAVCPLC